jgi:hypothetical protein
VSCVTNVVSSLDCLCLVSCIPCCQFPGLSILDFPLGVSLNVYLHIQTYLHQQKSFLKSSILKKHRLVITIVQSEDTYFTFSSCELISSWYLMHKYIYIARSENVNLVCVKSCCVCNVCIVCKNGKLYKKKFLKTVGV